MKRLLLNLGRAASLLAGRSVFESRSYRESERARLLNLFAHVDLERWRGMSVLEVGAGLGHLGDAFAALGFDVTSSDGRLEYVEGMRRRGRKAFVLDLDAEDLVLPGRFDLILAFGVLYHLEAPDRFLRSCGELASVLVLETCVSDFFEPVAPRVRERTGWRGTDQALHGTGSRPSPAWIERACRQAGFDSVRDVSSPLANWSIGRFDWEPRGTGEWRRDGVNLRKMWVAERAMAPGR